MIRKLFEVYFVTANPLAVFCADDRGHAGRDVLRPYGSREPIDDDQEYGSLHDDLPLRAGGPFSTTGKLLSHSHGGMLAKRLASIRAPLRLEPKSTSGPPIAEPLVVIPAHFREDRRSRAE
jgi:hypothetical protein